MLDFFVAPGVACDHGDTENVRLGRIDQREQRLHIGAAGAGTILIDYDFAFLLGAERRSGGQK